MSYRVVEGAHWWAVRTRSNFERKVHDQLAARRVEVFLPTYRKRSQRKDRPGGWFEAPLFSGYLFVYTDLSLLANRVEVLRARGVVNIVGGPTGPVAIPDFEIENVRRLCESDRVIAPWKLVRSGDVVRVVGGGLAGVVGVVVDVDGKHKKIVCNVELLNRAVSAELGADQIEILDPSEYAELKRKLMRGKR